MKNIYYLQSLSFIEKNIENNIDVMMVVKHIGYSRRAIDADFKIKTGITLGEYIKKRKLTRAAVLLKLSNIKITDIAIKLNYATHQNFARAFKHLYQCTPTEYRRTGAWDMSRLTLPILNVEPTELMFEAVTRGIPSVHGEKLIYTCDIVSQRTQKVHTRILRKAHEMRDKNGGCIYIYTKYGSINSNFKINVTSYIGNEKEPYRVKENDYLQFTYSGLWSEYLNFILAIYSTLPRLGITRNDDYDVEIFDEINMIANGDAFLHAKYLIPVDK